MTLGQKESDKKLKQKQELLLGETFNSCRGKLVKLLLFDLVKKTNQDTCHKCGEKIEHASELSIEHTTSWMSSPTPRITFFDLEKIAFSHLSCNKRAEAVCGTRAKYQKGCRCESCVDAESEYKTNRYHKLKTQK